MDNRIRSKLTSIIFLDDIKASEPLDLIKKHGQGKEVFDYLMFWGTERQDTGIHYERLNNDIWFEWLADNGNQYIVCYNTALNYISLERLDISLRAA